jgi:hypothetical protein
MLSMAILTMPILPDALVKNAPNRRIIRGATKSRQTKIREVRMAHTNEGQELYMSPKELALRWKCGRSTADRIARREGFRRLALGVGRNGTIRYVTEDVMAYEQQSVIAG